LTEILDLIFNLLDIEDQKGERPISLYLDRIIWITSIRIIFNLESCWVLLRF